MARDGPCNFPPILQTFLFTNNLIFPPLYPIVLLAYQSSIFTSISLSYSPLLTEKRLQSNHYLLIHNAYLIQCPMHAAPNWFPSHVFSIVCSSLVSTNLIVTSHRILHIHFTQLFPHTFSLSYAFSVSIVGATHTYIHVQLMHDDSFPLSYLPFCYPTWLSHMFCCHIFYRIKLRAVEITQQK